MKRRFIFWNKVKGGGTILNKTLYDQLRWREHELPSHAANGHTSLYVGETGETGETATLVAGVHGDEGPWGALALRQLLREPAHILKGRLRVVLAANPLALEADARNAPLDHLDLNRSFPGDLGGSHTEVLAATLRAELGGSALVVDLHGGGSWCVNAFAFRFEGSEALAAEIGAPFVVDAPEKASTLTQYARAQGARAVAVEMGGRSRDEAVWQNRVADGLLRVLDRAGVVRAARPLEPSPASIPVASVDVLRPRTGGLFVPTLREEAVGTVVTRDTELGRLLHPHTLAPLETFTAPFSQTALLLLRPHTCVLEGGAMTYVVAKPL